MVKTKTYNKIRKLLSITLIAVMLIGIFPPVTGENHLNVVSSIFADLFNVTTANASSTQRVTYIAEHGQFSNGTNQNVVEYSVPSGHNVTKNSHTPNISDSGQMLSDFEREHYDDVVTIPGAEELRISLTFSGDWDTYLSVYDGNLSQVDSLNGYETDENDNPFKIHRQFVVQGDTVRFKFRDYGYSYGDYEKEHNLYYGYYAVVSASSNYRDVVLGAYEEPSQLSTAWRALNTWNTAADGSGDNIDPSQLPFMNGDITLYAQYAENVTIVYNVNGGTFENGNSTNTVTYIPAYTETVVKKSHSANISEDGTKITDYQNYIDPNEGVRDVVTIPGASELTVNITYGLDDSECDCVSVLAGERSYDECWDSYNSDYRILNLSGYDFDNDGTVTTQCTISGDTVTFFLSTSGQGSFYQGYGYYATVTAVFEHEQVVVAGAYQEPTPDSPDMYCKEWNTEPDGSGDTVNPLEPTASATVYAIYAEDVLHDGTRGDWWWIKHDGALVIGNGTEMTMPISPKTYKEYDKWPWNDYSHEITSVRFDGIVHAKESTAAMFSGEDCNVAIDFHGFDTSNVTNMAKMFYGCSSLTSLDASGFDTSDVTYMGSMFEGCSSLTSLDVSEFDTSNVTNMSNMFSSCSALTSLDVSNFDTSNVTNMAKMFEGCSSLINAGPGKQYDLNLSGLDTSNVTRMEYMFSSCKKLAYADLNLLNTQNVIDVRGMFQNCSSLETIDVRNWDTSKWSYLDDMFHWCEKLSHIDISKWDFTSIISLDYTFSECSSLKNITFGNYTKTARHSIRMNYTFEKCSAIKEIDFTGLGLFDTYQFSHLFNGCNNLQHIYGLENIRFSANSNNCYGLFGGCENLEEANVNIEGVPYNLSSMFSGCKSLTSLTLNIVNTKYVTNMSSMFSGCASLTSLDLNAFDTSGATNLGEMFKDCKSLNRVTIGENFNFAGHNITSANNKAILPTPSKTVTTGKWVLEDDTEGISAMTPEEMQNAGSVAAGVWVPQAKSGSAEQGDEQWETLDGCEWCVDSSGCLRIRPLNGVQGNLKKTTYYWPWRSRSDIESIRVESGVVAPTDISLLFSQLNNCKIADLSGLDTSKATTMYGMFSGCSSLTSLDVSGFDTSKVTNMHSMFSGCSSLTSLDVSGFDTSKVTDMSSMFSGCSSLTSLDVNGFDTSKVTDIRSMFWNCSSLTSLDVSGFDTSNVTYMGSMFSDCSSLTSLDVSGFDTSNVDYMSSMFYGCSSLTSLDVSSFDTSNATSMGRMFFGCSSLTSLDLSNFDTSKVTYINEMFARCHQLSEVKLGNNFNFTGSGTLSGGSALLPTPSYNSTGKWVLADDESGTTALTAQQMSNAGVVMPGTWIWQMKPSEAIINFNGNGALIDGISSYSQSGVFEPITFPSTERDGYILTGWNTKADGTGTAYPAEGSITPVGGQNITLYAQWALDTRVNYLVKHYKQSAGVEPVFPDDYTLADTDSLKAEPGTSVTPDVMTYPYFTAPETQTVEVASDGSTVVNYLYNYAITTINFYGNGNDSGMMRTQDYAWARGDKLNKNLFSKTGHIFTGWNTAADGSGVSFSDRGLVPNAPSNPLNLFAQWQEISVQTADDTTGLFTVTLHAGEYARISGLPAGSTYEIVEVNIPNGWQLTNEEGTTGKIVSNDIKEANFLNTYSASGEADIQAHKLLNNGILSSGQFSFGLRKVGESEPLQIKTNGAVDNNATIIDQDSGEELPNPNYGLGDITFDPIEYTAEGVYQYEIYEIAPSPGDSDYDIGVQYDTRVLPVTVTVTDAGGGKLSANVTYPNGDRFTNSILPGSLHLIEALVESYTTDGEGHPQPGELIRDDDHIFTVTVHFTDDAGNPVPGEFPVRYVDENGNTTNGTISDGDVINIHTFKDALIAELPDGTQYSAVMRHDNGYEYYTAYEVEGTIVAGETKNGEFYIVPMPPEIVTTSITVKKTVRGNLSDVNKDFEFTLHLEDEQGNPYTGAVRFAGKEAGSTDLDGNGNMTFTLKHNEEISFIGLPVGIRYSVTERDYTADGYQTSSTNDSGITTAAPIQVDFINTNSAMVPTGINLQMASGITLVALAMLGVGIYISKHKKSKKADHTAE